MLAIFGRWLRRSFQKGLPSGFVARWTADCQTTGSVLADFLGCKSGQSEGAWPAPSLEQQPGVSKKFAGVVESSYSELMKL
jgi:hypothetical protein